MREIIPHDHPTTKREWDKFHAWRRGADETPQPQVVDNVRKLKTGTSER